MAINWDEFTPVDQPERAVVGGNVDWDAFEPMDPTERSAGTVATDILYGAAKGAGQLAQGAGWLVGSKGLENLGKGASEFWSEKQSPQLKAQLQGVEDAEGFWNTLGALKDNPAAFADMVVGSLPMMVPGMGIGSLGARGVAAVAQRTATQAAIRAGATESAAATVGRLAAEKSLEKGVAYWTAVGANVAGEGAVAGGLVGSNVEDFALEKGATPEEARSAANEAAIKSGLTTAGLAGIGARFETGALLGRMPEKGLLGLAKNVGKESLEEGLQNPAEEYFQYQGKARFDPTQTYDFGGSLAAGLATGGAMGGSIHGAGRASQMLRGEQESAPLPSVDDIGKAQTVDEAIAAAAAVVDAAAPSLEDLEAAAGMQAPAATDSDIPELRSQPVPRERDFVPPPAGSFAAMNELANLVGEERADVEQRRTGLLGQAFDQQVAAVDAAVENARQQASRENRRAVLDSVLDGESVLAMTPEQMAQAYSEALAAQDFANAIPTAREAARIERAAMARDAMLESEQPIVEPSLPNEMPDLVPEKKPAQQQSALARVKQLIGSGYALQGKQMVNPAGDKVNLRRDELTYAKMLARNPSRANTAFDPDQVAAPVTPTQPTPTQVAPAEPTPAPPAEPAMSPRQARQQEAVAQLESASSKELRRLATSDKRQYIRNAASDILQTRDAVNRQRRSDIAKRVYARSKQIDPDRDSMAEAIGKLGGISRDGAALRMRFAPEELRARAGMFSLFSKGGRSLDSMGSALAELGYVQMDEHGKHDQRDFEEKLAEVAGGMDVFTPNAIMLRAQAERDAAMDEVGATNVDDYTEVERHADAMEDFDLDVPFDSDDPRLQNISALSEEEIDELFGIQPGQGSRVSEVADAGNARESGEGVGAQEEGRAEGQEDAFALNAESADEGRARIAEAEQRQADARVEQEAAERKAEADAEVESFALTGSDRMADANPGQADIFSRNAPLGTDGADAAQKTAAIADFGEKIGGAKKDLWASYKDKLGAVADEDIANEPLSKIWPLPDYQALINAGADPWAVAFMRASRDEIPTKPRQTWKLRQWTEQVRLLRGITQELLDGTLPVSGARNALAEMAEKSRGMAEVAGRIELYMLVGHAKSLDGVRLSRGEYSILDGVEYSPAKVFWTVEKKVAATAFSNWPRELARAETKEGALAAFKSRYDALDINPPASRQVTFDIYSKHGQNGYFVGKKVGRNYIDLEGPLPSVKEARAFKADNQEELLSRLEKAKEIPRERRDTNEPRVGDDMRGGQDVTQEMFADAFGFRGVEFGNYVEQKRRQQDLNEAYDALMDMAAILQIPPKALSLNGELGLAFGARGSGGKGAAAAHYEPGRVVINLTKKQGAGSLGHEWWHALDNYFSRMRGKSSDMMTDALDVSLSSRDANYEHRGEVRKEMVDAYGAVVKAIKGTAIRARSSKLDAKRSKDYWTTSPEMSARAFESFLISKLQDQNASNDYLANIVDEETWKAAESLGFELDGTYPYPTAGEIPAIRAGFQHFFDTIQHKETDKGVALFSRGRGAGMPVSAIQSAVDRLTSTWQNAPRITVVASPADLPFAAPADARGAYLDGETFLVAGNLGSVADAQFVLFHEVLGHAGLRGMFGSDLNRELSMLAMKNASLRKAASDWRAKNADIRGDMTESAWHAASIEEALADMAGEGREISGIGKFLAAVQKALRAIGLDAVANWMEGATNAEALAMLATARRFIEQSNEAHVFGAQEAMAFARDASQFSRQDVQTAIRTLVKQAAEPGNQSNKVRVALLEDWLLEAAKNAGMDIAGYTHIIDSSAVRHTLKNHSDETAEAARGQVAVTAGDFEAIPAIVSEPDKVIFGTKNRLGREQVAYVKTMPDGSTLYLEEVRTGRRELAAVSLRKYPATMNAENIVSTLDPNARGDGGNTLIVVDAAEGRNPDIRFSRGTPQSIWNADAPSKMDDFLYAMQDKQIDTKRAVQAVKRSIQNLADQWDPYLQEELYHGRTAKQTQDFQNKELRTLMQDMQMRKVEIDEFEDFLHARHAKERNTQIAKVNPEMPDGGSGMTNQEVDDYFANLDPTKRRAMDALAKRVDAINQGTQQLLVSSGLEKQETIDAWNGAYQHYVPLQREEVAQGGMGTGQGFSVRGSASKRAMGSTKNVTNILANIVMQRERAIVRAEKNRVALATYGLAVQAPNKDFWLAVNPGQVHTPAQQQAIAAELTTLGLDPADAANIMAEPKQRTIDPRTGLVVDRVNPLLRSAPNVLAVRVDGEERYVFFSESDPRAQRMVMVLKNLDADQLGQVLGLAAKGTRWFAAVNTQYNPVFGVVNGVRDVQGALLNLSTTPIAGKQKEVLAHTLSALRGIYIDTRDTRAGRQTRSTWAQLYEEFQKEGGQTGFRDMFATSADRTKALERELNPDGWMDSPFGKLFTAGGALKVPASVAAKQAKGVFGWLSDYNTAMENAVRLAVYKVGKDNGMSNQQAASIAKNISVNFNRKGQVALQAGAMYAFFNASVQGTARMVETLTGPTGKKIIAGGLLLGVMQALLLKAAGFDDEEPPEFVRERNLVIPLLGSDGKYLSIPMPLGFHVLPSMSRITTEWALSGFKDTARRTADLVGLFADVFNPIGSAGVSVQTIAPTVVDPLVALSENRDWTGKPIARDDLSGLKQTPGHTRTKDTASSISKALSYWLNLASGGTKYQPGIFSPTPDQIDYLVGQVTGGVGREALKVDQTVRAIASGEDLPPHKIPLVGRFYGDTTGQSAVSSKFYSNLKRINGHKLEIEGRRKNREPVTDYLRDNPDALMSQAADATYKEVADLRKMKRELIERGASKDRIKLIEQRSTALMQRFNDRVESRQNEVAK